MQKLDLNSLISNHEYWKKVLKPEEAEKYITLSRNLLHKVIDNDGVLSGITISFPDDCLGDDLENYFIFQRFLDDILKALKTTIKKENGSEIVTFN